jgi:hypothetical protein
MDDIQVVLGQFALLGWHIGVAGTAETFHESSDVPGISAATPQMGTGLGELQTVKPR